MEFITKADTALVVIDIQEKFVPAIPPEQMALVLKNTNILIQTARTLGLPILTTEQYPKGLGPTVEGIRDAMGDTFDPVAKMHFSCARAPEFMERLEGTGRKSVMLSGIETHVCVLQTAIDLINGGYAVYLPADAVSSRRTLDWEMGLKSAERAGAVLGTTETFVFQLLEVAGTDEFKAISKLLR